MASIKNWIFDPSFPCPHASTWTRPPPSLWTSTWGRHEIRIVLLKGLVQWPSWPKAEIRLYDCNLFQSVLLIIFISNLYRRKISTFYSMKDEILVKKKPTSLREKKTGWCQWTVILIFCKDVNVGLDPSPRPLASAWALPTSPSVWTS